MNMQTITAQLAAQSATQSASQFAILPPQIHAVLHTLLDANASFSVDAKGTTNHFPMAVIALAELGADATRLQNFFAYWQEKFALAAEPVSEKLDAENWLAHLAKREQFANLRAFFVEWLDKTASSQVLAEVFHVLPFAPATGAFHALIRLAYGIHAKHNGEIAAGLAYLVSAHLPLPAVQQQATQSIATPEEGLALLSERLAGRQYTGPWITTKLREVAQDADFIDALPACPLTITDLAQLAHLAIAAYWQTKDFTVLHMVTGLHAARIVLAQLPVAIAERMLEPLWSAFAAAYVSVGAPPLQSHATLLAQLRLQSPAQEENWQAVFALAVASNNDHVIKFCYSSYQENLAYASPLYFAAAARLVQK